MLTRRGPVRELKLAVSQHGSEDAMIALLQRSFAFGHKKLFLIRYIQAEQMGIEIPPSLLAYWQQVTAGISLQESAQLTARAPRKAEKLVDNAIAIIHGWRS